MKYSTLSSPMTKPNNYEPNRPVIGALLREAACGLKNRARDAARLEAELLLAFVLGEDRPGLYRRMDEAISPQAREAFGGLLERRIHGEPLAYLTGEREFMGLKFTVSPAVLVPRPETELLVEMAISILEKHAFPFVLDVGTGSGAIAVSLAVALPQARVTAVDISEAALAIAGTNARRHGVSGRIIFKRNDLITGIEDQFDMIAANLPYISTNELDRLPDDVRFEPLLALDGGRDGLDLYRRLVPQAERLLKPGGFLLAELGSEQEQEILALTKAPNWQARVDKDWAGWARLLVAGWSGGGDGERGNVASKG